MFVYKEMYMYLALLFLPVDFNNVQEPSRKHTRQYHTASTAIGRLVK